MPAENKDDKVTALSGGEQLTQLTERQNELIQELIEQGRAQRAAAAGAPAPKPEAKPEPVYSQEELQALVDSGKITQGQMIAQLVHQGTTRVAAQLRKEHADLLAAERLRGTVESKIAAYKASIPQLDDKRSKEFKAASAAYDELIAEGHAEDMRTELLALRVAFPEGDKPRVRETTGQNQRSVVAPGSRAAVDDSGKTPSGKWPSYVQPHVAEYYEKAIAQGRYSGMKDPMLLKELAIRERRAKEQAA